jgi:hypothetical protein
MKKKTVREIIAVLVMISAIVLTFIGSGIFSGILMTILLGGCYFLYRTFRGFKIY